MTLFCVSALYTQFHQIIVNHMFKGEQNGGKIQERIKTRTRPRRGRSRVGQG
ncbi:MAG: hypothetical protein BAJATHORv1_30493 [Candidatus Thorarchaeota archaeon]|nr:MAG: hypothetical protein BAJATHORv1_30493 [Candidatus Thorarchaeota archaeon]